MKYVWRDVSTYIVNAWNRRKNILYDYGGMTETKNAIAYAAHLWIMFVTAIDWYVNLFIIEYMMTHFFHD